MDNHGAPPSEPRKGGLLSGRYHDPNSPQQDRAQPASRPAPPPTGGLLSRFGSQQGAPQQPAPGDEEGGWRGLANGARKFGQNLRRMTEGALQRAPRHGDWRATDFAPHEIDDWDQYGDVPFDLPPDPDAPEYDAPHARDARESRGARGAQGSRGQASGSRGGRRADQDEWDARDWDAEWDGGAEIDWENAAWDDDPAGWDDRSRGRGAYGNDYGYEEPPTGRGQRDGGRRASQDEWGEWDEWDGDAGGRDSARRQNDAPHWDVVGDLRGSLDTDAIAGTMAQLGAISLPITRLARVRMLLQRRPAAAAMLAFLLLGFMLTCCAPLAPLIRLGLDVSDLARRAEDLRALSAGGVTSLVNANNIAQAQRDIASIESDLYEINGAVAVVGAPLAAVNPTTRNYQLLVRIGYDLTGAANESLQIAQTLVTPLEGGALSTDSSTPGIQPADIQQARVLLSDAYLRGLDAIAAYKQLDPQTLPSQLKPGSKYGAYLAQLPLAVKVFAEMKDLIDAAPALLGVGQPAYYLAIALDRTELRPGGGFQGNYGLLELDGGKQSKTHPFGLTNTYFLDQVYTQKAAPNPEPSTCGHQVALPTNLYWWWPYRCIKQFGWGLRDADLSPDFPTNARLAMQIVEAGGGTPNGAPIQGVIAFTPGLIQKILETTGDLPMPGYTDKHGPVTVTPQNLEYEIHYQQLSVQTNGDRKQFTHDLSKALLDRLKSLHGSGLKIIFKIAAESIQSKDLQVYLADPRAELVLRQLDLASTVATGQNDGFFVVDTNDGGNKANLFVTEQQTDYVTLLPNGGAFHRLAISVTYDKKGGIFNPGSNFYDYSDIQSTYMPGDATIVGWSGFNPSIFQPGGCGSGYASVITDCSPDHGVFTTTTASNVAGRTMVMGALMVMCGSVPQGDFNAYDSNLEASDCTTSPQPHTQTIFISWYTPNAYTVGADGHGTYTELVEKQAGDDSAHLTVYVRRGSLQGAQIISDLETFKSLTAHATKIFDNALAQNQYVSYTF